MVLIPYSWTVLHATKDYLDTQDTHCVALPKSWTRQNCNFEISLHCHVSL